MLKKHKDRTTEGHKRKEAEFVVKLEDLFYIAHADALKLIKFPKDSLPLYKREKVCPGIIGYIGKVLATKEMQVKEWADMRQKRRQKADAEEMAYTSKAVSSSLMSCTTTTDAEEVAYTNRAVSGSSSFRSTSTDAEEVAYTSRAVSGSSSF